MNDDGHTVDKLSSCVLLPAAAAAAAAAAVPLCLQVLSDSNTDFLVVGVCSSDLTLAPALVAALAGKQSAAAAAAAAGKSQQLPGLQMHVGDMCQGQCQLLRTPAAGCVFGIGAVRGSGK
jgi:hypothetical protein